MAVIKIYGLDSQYSYNYTGRLGITGQRTAEECAAGFTPGSYTTFYCSQYYGNNANMPEDYTIKLRVVSGPHVNHYLYKKGIYERFDTIGKVVEWKAHYNSGESLNFGGSTDLVLEVVPPLCDVTIQVFRSVSCPVDISVR